MNEHLQIACEMLGIETIRMSSGEWYDETLLDDRLRDMLDRFAGLAQRTDTSLYSRQAIAAVIVAWEVTQPEMINKALIELVRARRDKPALQPMDNIGPGLRS